MANPDAAPFAGCLGEAATVATSLTTSRRNTVQVGSGDFVYEFAPDWPQVPDDIELGWVAAVAVDDSDRVLVYSRSEVPLILFDRDGGFVSGWQGVLDQQAAHGLFIDPEGNVWCTEYETHCVRKMSPTGELVMTLGTPGQPGAEGEPFRRPTDVAFDSHGYIYVSDGYDNARVHKYTADGQLLISWGSPGTGPGEFDISHCVRVDRDDRVLVCDRTNNRIQLFDTDGNYLEEWGGFLEPDTIHIDENDVVYVAELQQRVSILNLQGELLCRWGRSERTDTPGEFKGCPHGIWTDSHGDLYISEVQTDGRAQKFIRK